MKEGCYWVKWGFDWTIAKLDSGHWEMVGCGYCMDECDFVEIGDYIEMPERYREA